MDVEESSDEDAQQHAVATGKGTDSSSSSSAVAVSGGAAVVAASGWISTPLPPSLSSYCADVYRRHDGLGHILLALRVP